MNIFRKHLSKKKQQKQSHQSILMMESDTLGMMVIEEDQGENHQIMPLSTEQWVEILLDEKLDGYPYSRVYFSFLKGLPSFLRMKIWLFLVKNQTIPKTEKSIKPLRNSRQGLDLVTTQQYIQLSTKKPQQKEQQQINKDINRSYSGKEKHLYTKPLLKRILHALSNWGVNYTQGMNYILLNVIIHCLNSVGINQSNFQNFQIQIQKNIFIILVGIVLLLQQTFGQNNIFKVIKQLEEKIAQTSPQVLFLIFKFGLDCFCCFSPNYFSLMSYGDSPEQLNAYMMDLFFLEGEKAIHAMIVRMIQIATPQILLINDAQVLQKFFKNDIFLVCYETLKNDQKKAKKISDFGMSFYQNMQNF